MNLILERKKKNNYRISKEYNEISGIKKSIEQTNQPTPFSQAIQFPKEYQSHPRPIPALQSHNSAAIILSHSPNSHPSLSPDPRKPSHLVFPVGKFFIDKSFESSEVNTASIKRGLDSIRAFVPLIRRTREVMRGHRAYCPLASGHSWSQ